MIAATKLLVVVGEPLHFKVVAVTLPAEQSSSFHGAAGFIYQVSGSTEISIDGTTKTLSAAEGGFVAGMLPAMLRAAGGEPSTFLHCARGIALGAVVLVIGAVLAATGALPEGWRGPVTVVVVVGVILLAAITIRAYRADAQIASTRGDRSRVSNVDKSKTGGPQHATTTGDNSPAINVQGGGTIDIRYGETSEDAERRHREVLEAIAREKGVDPSVLRPLFEHLGRTGASLDEMRTRAHEAIEAILARAREKVQPSNDGADIDATIGAARTKLRGLDTAGALSILDDKIAEEEAERQRRLITLLEERAAILSLSFDYDAAKATLKRLLMLDPDRVWRWIDLGDLWVTTGNLTEALAAFRNAGKAAQRTGDERERSVSQGMIGVVQQAQGDLAAALASYKATLAIQERLAKADPGNAGWQHDLSVSHEKIGDVQVEQGDLAAALTRYQASLAIRDRLAQADPGNAGWQRDLSVSHDRIGDVQVDQGELAAALTSYQASLAIRERLAKADPGNAGWQRDLSVSHNKIGDVQVAQGELAAALTSYQASLAIRERLAKADPGNAGWQRDLSVSLNKIGDVQVAQGELGAALTSYQASHDIFDRLAKADPGNAGWQRDLSVSHDRIGSLQLAQGELAAALTSHQASLAIRERLAKADPGNAGWQRDLAMSFGKIGRAQIAHGERVEALRLFQRGRAIVARLSERSPDNAQLPVDLAQFDAEIARLAQ
jgi:tetratricopeptide (TPR) repeat protein